MTPLAINTAGAFALGMLTTCLLSALGCAVIYYLDTHKYRRNK